MTRSSFVRNFVAAAALVLGGVASLAAQTGTAPSGSATPKVGDTAADFTLTGLDGKTVRLSEETTRGPVVLLMMRGWPGYQCPFCTRQFGDYLANAERLKTAGATVVFVYPGPGEGLVEHAQAFTAGKDMPGHFRFVTDPDYTFTNSYGLRWDAAKETAYPATFVLDRKRVVTFVNVSREHGGRVPVADVLAALR
jgi:thioredoxin-dependent peroxiredoxin